MLKSKEDQIDAIFGALSDRSRRKMLFTLTQGEKSVMELGEPLGMSKQLVSKHLKVLEKAGLITKEKNGRIQRCQFNPDTFNKIQELIETYSIFWNQQFDALEEYVEKLQENKDE